MKVTVVGAGSTYTPELVEGFADREKLLGLDEFVLYDIDHERLQIVGGLAKRILDKRGFGGKLIFSENLEEAVTGASAVLIQLRVGGQITRYKDETLPNPFGLIGQETTGIGGFFKALRTVPVLLDIADTVRRLAGPDCWIIDFTNPVGIETRALLDAGHRAIGLCNVGIGFQRHIADIYGVDHNLVRLDHAGLNHLTWIRSIMVDGQEKIDDILARDDLEDFFPVSQQCCRTLRAVPSYYLRYFYATDEELAKQLGGEHRAQRVMEIEHELLEMYKDPALDHKPALLEERGGAYYSTAAAALTVSLLTGDGAHHYIDTYNNGTLPGLPDGAVVEVPALVDTQGPHPVPVAPLAKEMLGLVQAITAYEELTIEAALSGDPEIARRALIAHPLVRQWSAVDGAFSSMVRANAYLLPRFAGCCCDE